MPQQLEARVKAAQLLLHPHRQQPTLPSLPCASRDALYVVAQPRRRQTQTGTVQPPNDVACRACPHDRKLVRARRKPERQAGRLSSPTPGGSIAVATTRPSRKCAVRGSKRCLRIPAHLPHTRAKTTRRPAAVDRQANALEPAGRADKTLHRGRVAPPPPHSLGNPSAAMASWQPRRPGTGASKPLLFSPLSSKSRRPTTNERTRTHAVKLLRPSRHHS